MHRIAHGTIFRLGSSECTLWDSFFDHVQSLQYTYLYTIRTTDLIEQRLSNKVYKGRKRIDVYRLPLCRLCTVQPIVRNQFPYCNPNYKIGIRAERKSRCATWISLRSSVSSTAKVLQLNGWPFATCPTSAAQYAPYISRTNTIRIQKTRGAMFPVMYAVCSLSRSILKSRGKLSEL